MDSNPRFGLIGSGSWATAIAKMLLTNTDELNWWVRREETKDHLLQYGRNPNYIQSIEFDTSASMSPRTCKRSLMRVMY